MSEEETLPNWKVSTTDPELAKKIKNALRQVRDPEIGNDVVQLGLIREIEVSDKNATVTMILTTPYCPFGPALMESARRVVEKEAGKPTTVIYGSEMWDQSMMEDPTAFGWGLF